jgi:MinD-like ATPase involved in chromosome partitioning or flagellar assembly
MHFCKKLLYLTFIIFDENWLLFISVNLAVALALKCDMKIGLLDADVYGPSIPTLMKLQGKPAVDSGL